jgi:hypothetical protein
MTFRVLPGKNLIASELPLQLEARSFPPLPRSGHRIVDATVLCFDIIATVHFCFYNGYTAPRV